MATYTFKPVPVWGSPGNFARVGVAKAQSFPVTTLAGSSATVVQGGTTRVGYVLSDANGMIPAFTTTDIPSVVVDLGFGVVTMHSLEAITAGAASAASAASSASAAAASAATAASTLSSRVGKGDQAVNAKDSGAVGNGVDDDTSALASALTAAAGASGVVLLPPGRYLTTGITIPAGVTLRGSGKGATTIVQQGTPQFLVQARGTATANVTTLTANAAAGATTLTLASTAGLAAGDLIALHDNVSYNPNDSSYKSGEMLRILTVNSATLVTLMGPVRGSWATTDGAYTTANGAAIDKLDMARGVKIEHLSLEGDPASLTNMFIAQYVDGLDLSHVDIVKGGNQGLRIDSCRDVTIDSFTCTDLVDDVANGHAGYGIALSGVCENVTVSGGVVSRVRHAITTIGNAVGMPHNVSWTGAVVTECSNSGLDTHAAGDGFLFADFIVASCLNGVNIRTRNTHLKGGLIDQSTSHGVNFNETHCKDVSVQGVTVRRSGGYGIVAAYPVDGLTLLDNVVMLTSNHAVAIDSGSSRVAVGRNFVQDYGTGTSGRVGIFSNTTNGGTPATTGWDVYGNVVRQLSVTTAANALNLLSASLTGARAYDNRASGTYSGTVFNVGAATSSRNVKTDATPPSITGSRGGNAALASLLTQLAAQGLITDGTSA